MISVINIEIKEEYYPAGSDDMHTIIFVTFADRTTKYIAIKMPFSNFDLGVAFYTFAQVLHKMP